MRYLIRVWAFLAVMAALGVSLSCVARDSSSRDSSWNGVFRYDIQDLTTDEMFISDTRLIQYGSYRAYFGHGPAALYRADELGKDIRVMHTGAGLVGKALDLSDGYEERWEGDARLVIEHIDRNARDGHLMRRIFTRIPTQPSDLDGVWRVTTTHLDDGVTVAEDRVLVRYGDYVAIFVQKPEQRLYAVFALQEQPNKYRIIRSTNDGDAERLLDYSVDYNGHWDGEAWMEEYIESNETATGRRIRAHSIPLAR